jgi:hypothetical protein
MRTLQKGGLKPGSIDVNINIYKYINIKGGWCGMYELDGLRMWP